MTEFCFKALIFSVIISFSGTVIAEDSLSKSLAPSLSVTGDMTTDKFSKLMQQGFKSVIVNRPDQESGNKVSVNALREIAEANQVGVIYQPVTSGKINQIDINEFAEYYNDLPKPILMVCKSGTRSASLYHQAKEQGLLDE
ncbi:beta-lactamase hydrolase domain-containing protein [Acinetobacter equi]|uniref:Beta-lactamase hydrolase-like protein phosphatase-like domain-containing protein n=1 Tax=Acinetobacter equi TaxID=1324350 RepID=A0A0N9W0P7_9GAMM|nr:sulfur transferase domain-containing protein [Acinetobacter equi]ALH95143.1 hypothetical protein AOY20_06120 [Acinetobacter equi]